MEQQQQQLDLCSSHAASYLAVHTAAAAAAAAAEAEATAAAAAYQVCRHLFQL
jgi:hypothetical protein